MDGKTIQPAAPIKPIITVWAEEKGPLGNGHYEFSFGNGSSASEHAYGGYCMSAPGRIIRGSLTVTESRNILSEEVKVNIVVNGKEQVNHSIVKQEGHDGPVSLHWLIREIHSYQTLHYLGIGLKHKTPYKD